MANMGKPLVEALAIAIVYIATAQLGFLAAIPPGNVTVVWPPSGIALAAMLLLGYRAWAVSGWARPRELFFTFTIRWSASRLPQAALLLIDARQCRCVPIEVHGPRIA
jgi:hypothetical protein